MKTIEINSSKNPTFKTFLRLRNPRDIRKHGRAILSGPKQTREVLKEFPDQCTGIIFSSRHAPPDFPGTDAIPRYCLSPELFGRMDCFGTKHPVLIVRAESLPRFDGDMSSPGCTLCIPFQDPSNVGAAIRASAAFGVSKIVFLKEAAHPFHPKSVRAAGSNIFRTPLYQGPPLTRLNKFKTPLIILTPGGKAVARFNFPESFCLVPGLEGPGIPEILKGTAQVSIPMAKGVESLNAAMATGIVLYAWQYGRPDALRSREAGTTGKNHSIPRRILC
jgi:tRNA G18 (ribose-2'-O)-methylase SpoU